MRSRSMSTARHGRRIEKKLTFLRKVDVSLEELTFQKGERMIKKLNDQERLNTAGEMLRNAHALFGVQCQNCRYYKPEPDLEDLANYRGTCEMNEHKTFWSQYCDDFEVMI